MFMVGVAVGTLAGSGLLFLIPEVSPANRVNICCCFLMFEGVVESKT